MQDFRDVIKRPIITEKTMKLQAEKNQYTFEVPKTVNKIEVKHAVEALFGVDVEKVAISNTKAKMKRSGVHYTKINGYKKAIVTVKEGQSIPIFGDEEE